MEDMELEVNTAVTLQLYCEILGDMEVSIENEEEDAVVLFTNCRFQRGERVLPQRSGER